MDTVTIGERIRRAREIKGWSVNRLDKEIGASTGYSSRVERGERLRIPPDKLAAYARALEIDVAELVGLPKPGERQPDERPPWPNLEAAILHLGKLCTPGAAAVARRVGQESPVDLDPSDWTVLLLDLSRKI